MQNLELTWEISLSNVFNKKISIIKLYQKYGNFRLYI